MTTPDLDPVNLEYIEIAARECLVFVENLDFDEFFNDRKTRAATVWQISVMGEAANRLSEGIQQQAPEIDWRGMIDMRNRLIHQFNEIDYTIVWEAVQEDLRPLIASVRRLQDNLYSGLS